MQLQSGGNWFSEGSTRLQIQEDSFAWLATDVAVIRDSDGISTRMPSCGLSTWSGILKASDMIGRKDSQNQRTKREITETFKPIKSFD